MMTPTAMVFVIDDDQSVRKSLERLLDAAHYRIELFKSASRVSLAFSPSRTFMHRCRRADAWTETESICRKLSSNATAKSRSFLITGYGNIPMCAEAMKAGAVRLSPKAFQA